MVDRSAAKPGDLVRVVDPGNKTVGTAHYSSTSQICLRLLSTHNEAIDYAGRLSRAREYRERVVRDTNAYRLVHAEGDLLPALIVDRYADAFVVQTLDQGMERAKPAIVDALAAMYNPRAIVERNDAGVRDREELPRVKGVLRGELPGPVEIEMNGVRMGADLLEGQKTGVYLDQRENYLAAARFGRGRALDCFTSTGGFALHLARPCDSVTGVDASEPALATARENAGLNGVTNVRFEQADAFDFLAARDRARDRYDVVVIDPPAFAKSRQNIEAAARGYKDLNLRALRLLDRGGVLVTCSCSFHFSEALLLETVASAALEAGRNLRVVDRRSQAADHPILLTVPETHYLKCIILEVV